VCSSDLSTIHYSTSSCFLTISFASFSDKEPADVVAYLANKTMVCAYTQGRLTDQLVRFPPLALDSCGGELKDAVLASQAASLLTAAS